MLERSIFRAYDIRGVVGETLHPEVVELIGLGLGKMAKDANQKTFYVARDGRLSGSLLSESLCRGLQNSGIDVIDLGMVPTPVLYFAAYACGTGSGVMITGSHNPPEYNGLKMMIGGKTLAKEDIQVLYKNILNKAFVSGKGHYQETPFIEKYIQNITNHIHLQKPLKVVVDCGNGVAGLVAPKLFEALGCDVVPLFCEVDGTFPNHHPDPAKPDNLQDLIKAVKTHHADVGFAFDGDGDRLGVVTPVGEIIWPDRLLMLFAKDILSRHAKAKIVYDVKCTKHLDPWVKDLGGEPIMHPTGHSFIKAKMRESGALLAGEMSGHFFFKERWYGFDDGCYAGARLLEILARELKNPENLGNLENPEKCHMKAVFETLPKSGACTPELQVPISDEKKFDFIKTLQANNPFEAKVITLDGLRVEYPDGWGLVRPSNTSPCLVCRFEADSQTVLARIQAIFKEALLALDPALVVPF